MNNISGIYVVDNKELLIFTFERHRQNSNTVKNALLSHFIYALQSIASQLESDESRVIEIKNENYLIIKDSKINFKYIIKYSKETALDQISVILNKIKNKFIESFEGRLDLPVPMKTKLVASLRDDILEILEEEVGLKRLL